MEFVSVVTYNFHAVSTVTRPIKELIGFMRVFLEPDETKTVQFEVRANQFAFHNRKMDFVVEPGEIRLMVGSSSNDIHCSTSLQLTGDRPMQVDPKGIGNRPEVLAA
ncbi:MAG: fibronectin type III-like domain-contianing protein [Chloroflexota bacterium]